MQRMTHTDVRDATHVKLADGSVEKIKSKWGVGPDGRLAKPSEGGFGVITETDRRVGMTDAHSYFKIEIDQAAVRAEAAEALALAERIYPILAGRSPDVQGAALADVVAVFIAGHHPDVREAVLTAWLKCMQQMIPIAEAQGLRDHPEGWTKQ